MLKNNYVFFIITNQPGIGMSLYPVEDFEICNNYLINLLKGQGITIERTHFCAHTGGCTCRKPSTKYIEEVARDFEVNLRESWVVGDHLYEIIMAIDAGCGSVCILTSHGKKHPLEPGTIGIKPTPVEPDFLSATRCIKGV